MATITTTKMAPHAGRTWWRQGLLGCGIVSSVLYIATDVIASLRYPGYSYADQQISELLAVGAPSRPFMVAFNLIPYDLLVVAFAVGVWAVAGRIRAGRITAALLVGFVVSSYGMMLWTALLAVGLLRAGSTTALRQLEQPTVTPQPLAR